MSTINQNDPVPEETRTPAQDISSRSHGETASSTPLEMSSLNDKGSASNATDEAAAAAAAAHDPALSETTLLPKGPVRTDTTTALAQSNLPLPPPPSVAASVPLSRTISTAIGPSTDQPSLPLKDETTDPTLMITLLLTSGARHPFKLDAKYLSKRNVEVAGNDPLNLSVYKLKELILREWRDEWETKPSSPSYIRLISFGKLLDDKAPLRDSRFNMDATNVVHMTIKPQDYVEDEDTKGAKAGYSASREGTETRSPGCRCIVM